jgi:uncharacterized protein involved in exopolysaccharide biosynthesis
MNVRGMLSGSLFVFTLAFAAPAFADTRTDRLEALAAALVRYGEQHPEVIRLRAELTQLPADHSRERCAALELREREIEREITALSERFGDAHPELRSARARRDVIHLERTRCR